MRNKVKQLLRWRPGGYLGASAALTGWLMVRAGSQAVMTLAIARTLGPESYGTFVAIIALASIFSPLAGFGLGGVLLIRGARTPEALPQLTGACLRLWAGSTLLSSVAAVTAVLLSIPVSEIGAPLFLLVFAEIAGASLIELVARAEQSQRNGKNFGILMASLAIARLMAALLFFSVGKNALAPWMAAYAAATLLICTLTLIWFFKNRRIEIPAKKQWSLLREGFPFAIGAISFRLQGEFNKPVLAQFSLSLAGNLNIAQRAVDLISLPLIALQETLWPRFYTSNNPLRQMLPFVIGILAIALTLGGLIILAAPAISFILGEGYESSAVMIMWLAWLPSIQILRNSVNALVIARGRQELLTPAYLLTGIIGVWLNIWLIGDYAVAGAITSAYLLEAIMILILSITLFVQPLRSTK